MSADTTILILKFFTGYRVATVQAVENIIEFHDARVVSDYFDHLPDHQSMESAFEQALDQNALHITQMGYPAIHGIRIAVWDGIVNAKIFQYFGIMKVDTLPDSILHDITSWSIRIPDLPGCHSEGAETFNEAMTNAVKVTTEWVSNHVSQKLPMPQRLVSDAFEIEKGETPVVVSITISNSPLDPKIANVSVKIEIDSTYIEYFSPSDTEEDALPKTYSEG